MGGLLKGGATLKGNIETPTERPNPCEVRPPTFERAFEHALVVQIEVIRMVIALSIIVNSVCCYR